MAFRPALSYYQQRGHRILTAPTVLAVSAAQLRTFVRADATSLPDADAEFIIKQATDFIEQISGLALLHQSWQLTLDSWPGYLEPWWDGVVQAAMSELSSGKSRWLTLPKYPLSSITSVTTYDEADASTVVTVATVFQVDSQRMPGRLALKNGQLWPTAPRNTNAIEIIYVAGFGAAAATVPASLQRAVLQFSSFLYENRGGCDLQDGFSKSGARDIVSAYSLRGV